MVEDSRAASRRLPLTMPFALLFSSLLTTLDCAESLPKVLHAAMQQKSLKYNS
jgi:hypothetical protein